MTNYLSFSVYGQDSIYLDGALENAKSFKKYYPGWQAVFYVDEEIKGQPAIQKLSSTEGALVIYADKSLSLNPMTWRFAAALLPDANYVIFRDADSRISTREAQAVREWQGSNKAIHIMRDHPFHSEWILGGMWGCQASKVADKIRKVLDEASSNTWGEDQKLLEIHVYKAFKGSAFVHDSFFCRERDAKPFSLPRTNFEFVGERIDSRGRPEKNFREVLNKFEKSYLQKLKLRIRDLLRIAWQQLHLRKNLKQSHKPKI